MLVKRCIVTQQLELTSQWPLHGISIFLKDNIYTADRTSTSAGSYALLGSKPAREATVARKLRESGAILLGKVNMSEWANFRSGPNNGSNGWSARGGQTYGAFAPGTDPDGSSSGSAISCILGLSFAAIGTEVIRAERHKDHHVDLHRLMAASSALHNGAVL